MLARNRTIAVLLFLIVIVMVLPRSAAAEPDTTSPIPRAGVLFLLVSNSPRINGMGGCGIALMDEQSALYNPAALGVFHLDKVFAVSSPSTTDWMPLLKLDMRYKTFNISIGGSTKLLYPESERHLSLGLAYGIKRIDYGADYATDESGIIIDTIFPEEKVEYLSLGVGLEHVVRLGAGFTVKKIHSDLTESGVGIEYGDIWWKGTAYDMGIYADLPLGHLISGDSTADMYIDITPALAYVYANRGEDIMYIDAAEADPLPREHQISLSLYGGLNTRTITLLSGRLAWEHERWAISGAADPINKYGLELGFGNALFLRGGYHNNDPGKMNYTTFGIGLSLHGILRFLARDRRREDAPTLYYFMTHADLAIDYARYFGDKEAYDGTNFLKFSLSF